MLSNYIKSAYRNLITNRAFALVNLVGLSTGLTACILIGLYIGHESSYDTFYDDHEKIHRVALERVYPDRLRNFASSPVTLAPAMQSNLPEVESVTRVHRLFFLDEIPVRVEENIFMEDRFYFADSSFFQVFEHDFIHGDPSTALDNPTGIVLTESHARKLYGETDVLDRTFHWDTTLFSITGIIRDLPKNTHMRFDMLGSIHVLGNIQNAIRTQAWINPWVYTYVRLNEEGLHETISAKLPDLVNTYGAGGIARQLGEDYVQQGHEFNYFLQPIRDIHLNSNLTLEIEPNSSKSYLLLLGLVAVFILIISSINYVNISTARSAERAKEVGIRKTLGSSRMALMFQFLTESIFVTLMSMVLAFGLIYWLSDQFMALVGQELQIGLLLTWPVLPYLVLGAILLGTIAGIYPAFVISSLQSAKVLKGSFKSSGKGLMMRNALISLQFIVSLVMIAGVLLVSKQMDYISEIDLGFEKENLLVIDQAGALGSSYEAFKAELERSPGVISVGAANSMPGDFIGSSIYKSDRGGQSDMRANVSQWGDNYAQTMDMELILGRPFDRYYNDSAHVVINEAAARSLQLDDPIGARLRLSSSQSDGPVWTIVGMVKDYNFFSLHSEISPLVLFNSNFDNGPGNVAVRISGDNLKNTREEVRRVWRQFVPEQDPNLSFLDTNLEMLYQSDKTSTAVFSSFTLVAVILACIGLFGLAAYTIQQRTREIGIRKVLGATQVSILVLLVKNFIVILLVSAIIAIPITYWGMSKWFDNFAYHTTIDALVFVKAALLTCMLILTAVGYQALRIARLEPMDTLRTE